MRIALWHNLPSGGGKRALHHQVRGLVARGHTIEVWCPPSADRAFAPLGDLVTEHVVPLDPPLPSRSAPWARLTRPPREVRHRLEAMQRHCLQCAGEIARAKFDVLFAHSCQFFATSPIGRQVDLPGALFLQEPHRALYEAMPIPPWLLRTDESRPPGLLRRLVRHVGDSARIQAMRRQLLEERRNAAGFDVLLVNSAFSRESVLRSYGLESSVCYLGVDADRFQPSETKERFIVGLGSIDFAKGIGRAIRAVAAIPPARRPPFLWIGNYARPDHRRQIEALASDLDVALELRVGVEEGALTQVLGRAAVMLYTPWLEPFGFAPLEANACGTPVVAIAEGGVRETVVDGVNGILVADDNPHALALALAGFLDNPQRTLEIGRAAREHVMRHWTWAASIDRLEERLLALHERGRRG